MTRPHALTENPADALTLPSEQRDFPDWRHGRRRYAVWALDVDLPDLRRRSADTSCRLADYLLPGYRRQPHLTISLCGFPAVRPALDDDYAGATFAAQVAALAVARPAPFAIEIGGPASFSSAAYFSVGDLQGGVANLRRILAGEGATDDFPFVPHVSFGLYRAAFPLSEIFSRFAELEAGEPLRLEIGQLSWMTYEAAVIGGPLTSLAEFDFRQASLRVAAAGQMAELFGEAWRAPGFA